MLFNPNIHEDQEIDLQIFKFVKDLNFSLFKCSGQLEKEKLATEGEKLQNTHAVSCTWTYSINTTDKTSNYRAPEVLENVFIP